MASLVTSNPLIPCLERGCSAAFLVYFITKYAKDVQIPTGEFVPKFVAPLTKSTKLDWVNHHQQINPTPTTTLVEHHGKTTHFVSHAWRGSLYDLFMAVIEYDQNLIPRPLQKNYYWIDIFAVSQHQSKYQSSDLNSLGEVVKEAKATLLFLQPWNAPILLTRIWCLYEIHLTLMSSNNNNKTKDGSSGSSASGSDGGASSGGIIMLTAEEHKDTAETETGINTSSKLRVGSNAAIEEDMLSRLDNYNDLYLLLSSIDCRKAGIFPSLSPSLPPLSLFRSVALSLRPTHYCPLPSHPFHLILECLMPASFYV